MNFGFIRDTKQLWYAVEDNGKQWYVIAGRKEDQFKNVWLPIFSPDSNHHAYLAQEQGKDERFVVLDGKKVARPQSTWVFYPFFLDDQTLRFVELRGDKLVKIEVNVSTKEIDPVE